MSFCDDSNFITKYLSLYNSRFTSGSLAVEYDEQNTSSKKAMLKLEVLLGHQLMLLKFILR